MPLMDSLVLGAAFLLAFWIRIGSGLIPYDLETAITPYILLFFLSLPACLIIFYTLNLYDSNEIYYGTAEYVQVIKGVAFCIPAIIFVSYWIRDFNPSRGWLLCFWILGTIFLGIERFSIRRIIRPLFRSGKRSEPVLIVGANEEACIIAKMLMETGQMKVMGFLDEFSAVGDEVIDGIIIKGSPHDYERVAAEEGVSKIIMVPEAVGWETSREILSGATKSDRLRILLASGLSELSANLLVSYVGYVPLLRFKPGYVGGFNKFIKSIIDLSFAVFFLLLSLPLMLAMSGWIFWRQGRPIFETQEVIGVKGRTFLTYKFRSRRPDTGNSRSDSAEEAPNQTGGAPLIGGLDRLPQLFNVIKGQMSLVGPRPISKEESRRYGIWLPSLLGVKPGITGLWAIEEVGNLQQEISRTLSYIYTWTPWKDFQVVFFSFFLLSQRHLTGKSLPTVKEELH